MNAWLSDSDWQWAQAHLPVPCVDLLPIRSGAQREVGLIRRTTPHQGLRWCLIGGRVRHGESVVQAQHRHWQDALAGSLPMGRTLPDPPLVVEYLPGAPPDQPHDPRKHAISLTQATFTDGPGSAAGSEAHDFAWFPVADLNDDEVGFGQLTVVRRLLDAVDQAMRAAP